MKVTTMPRIRPLSFGHKFGNRYGHLIDRDFLMGRDPYESNWMTGEKRHPVNIKEHQDYYLLEVPLPGYQKNQITIHLENDILSISGKKEQESEKDLAYILKEYDIDSFKRSFQLGSNTDQGNITASFKDGVLYIMLNHVTGSSSKTKSKTVKIS